MSGWESCYSRPESPAEGGDHQAKRCLVPCRGPPLVPPSTTLSGRSQPAGCRMKATTTPVAFPTPAPQSWKRWRRRHRLIPQKETPPPPLHEITPVAMGSCASGNSPHHAPPVPPKRHPEQPSSHQQQRPDLSVFTVNKKKSPGRKNKPAHSRLFLYIRRQQK